MTNEVTQEIEESTAADISTETHDAAIDQPENAGATETAETPAAESTEAVEAAQEPSAETEAAAQAADAEPVAETPPPAEEPAAAVADESVTADASDAATADASAPVAEAPAEIELAAEETAPAKDVDFGAILEQFEQEQVTFHPGELVEGTVVGVSDRGVMVDFGYKSEGFAPVEEFTGEDGELNISVGDTVEVVLRSMHSGDGPPQLSRNDALARKTWDVIEKAFNDEETVKGIVVDKTKGGLKVDLNGIEAFLPGSQVDSRPVHSLDQYKGQEIEAKIIKFSRRRNNVVLSRKILTDEVVNQQKAETLERIDVGHVVEGTIKNLTEYGAFVDIGGIDGLLHVTDMSWGRLHHPGDMFKVADHVQVKILKLDREREKISLGYKQLQPDPWSTVIEVYPVNTQMKGKVSSVTDYGVFVELEPGVEGLVHVSEISWARRSQSPKRMFNRGDEVDVQVLGVDTDERRISLGMKQLQDNPWDTVDQRYPIGTKIHGRVRNITDFGAFVELEEGIDGLVHVSDITWAKKIKHPKDVLKKDQEVDAIVTSIDKQGQRLSLSMKDLTPSVWESFIATHRPGDVIRGKVSRFTNFGIFVELDEGLEGLCHISELSDERVDRPESVAELGQEMEFKILRIEQADQKIGLSHRAVGKEDEPVVDSKIYTSEAKGGMASLGELAKLKLGAADDAPADEPVEKKSKKERRAEQQAAKAEAAESDVVAETEAADDTAAGESPAAETEVTAGSAETEETAPVETETEPVAETAEVAVESSPADEAEAEAEAPSGSEDEAEEAADEPAAEAESEPAEASDETSEAADDNAEVAADATESDENENAATEEAAAS